MITLEKMKEIENKLGEYFAMIAYVITGTKASVTVYSEVIDESTSSLIEQFFKYPMIDNISLKNKSLEEILKDLQSVSLNEQQKLVLSYLRTHTIKEINKLKDSVTSNLIEKVNSYKLQEILGNSVTATDTRVVAREISKELRTNVRNWSILIHTEMWNAYIYSQAQLILDKYGENVKVYKKVEPTACKHCKKHYLNSNGEPKVFFLSDLLANRTNFGKKVEDWLPVIGSMHPSCMCRLVVVDSGDISPPESLIKSVPKTNRTVDKTKLVYVKKLVNNHGVLHEQGFYVKPKDAPSGNNDNEENTEAEDYSDTENKSKLPPYRAKEGKLKDYNKASDRNISGLNQNTGAEMYNSDYMSPQTVSVSIDGKSQDIEKLNWSALPDKRRKYYQSILGFDFGTMLSVKYIFGTKKAIDYAIGTGFNIKVTDDLSNSWMNTLREVEQFLTVFGTANEKNDYTNSIMSGLVDSNTKLKLNNGDFARLVHEVTGGILPTVGVLNTNTEKVETVETLVGDNIYNVEGIIKKEDFMKKLQQTRGKLLVPMTLKKIVDDSKSDKWEYNGVEFFDAVVSKDLVNSTMSTILEKLKGKKGGM